MVHTRHSYSKDVTSKDSVHAKTNGHDHNSQEEVNSEEQESQIVLNGDQEGEHSKCETNEIMPRKRRRSEVNMYTNVDYHSNCHRRSLRNLERSSASFSRSRNYKKFNYGSDLHYGHCTIRRSDRQPKKVFETCNESEIQKTIERKHQEMLELQGSMYDSIKRRRGEASDTQEDFEDDDEDVEEEEEEEEGDEDSEQSEEENVRGYSLRKTKPKTNLYQAPPSHSSMRRRQVCYGVQSPLRKKKRSYGRIPQHASSPRYQHRRRERMSSTSSSSDDDAAFERRKAKSMVQGRARCLPMNFGQDDMIGILKSRKRVGVSTGASLADVDPMTIDNKITFSDVGGLEHHINSLKEMVVFPLLYPEVFQKFNIAPPRGVLFYGPPGTGKTLVARALANECSNEGQKIAFFMRKGADCLSKWVGESERQLRLLFDQAYSMRPSIIFFDEIDGIAPVRSTRQDQIHSSIVSTLLALMDGLDARGEIVVIGATNRLDAIDPALRRPGRFDREFLFNLPNKKAREKILEIHTSAWSPKLSKDFLSEVAERCVGYCGADVKALCTEAALCALRRRYPQIYESSKKLLLDVNQIKVGGVDFKMAMESITPAMHRSNTSLTTPLSQELKPLLEKYTANGLDILNKNFPPGIYIKEPHSLAFAADEDEEEIYERSRSKQKTIVNNRYFKTTLHSIDKFTVHRPRFLITGVRGNGQSMYIAPALLYAMEHITAHTLDLPTLYGTSSRNPEEAIAQIFREAKRTAPSILYLPHVSVWWTSIQDTTRATFMTLLEDLPSTMPVLLLATADVEYKELPETLQDMFSSVKKEVLELACPISSDRYHYFKPLFLIHALKTPSREKRHCRSYIEVLPEAPPPKTRELSKDESKKLLEYEENIFRELRLHLRQVTWKLIADRKFKEFSKPVDLEEVDDYLQVIKEPMDLSTVMTRINAHYYQSCAQYLGDIDLITNNCLEYNPDKDQYDRLLRNRVCELRDVAHALVLNDLDEDFEKTCNEICENRKSRGFDERRVAPSFLKVLPKLKTSNTSIDADQTTETNKPIACIPDPTGTRYSRRVRGLDEPTFDSSMLELVERRSKKERRTIDTISEILNSPCKIKSSEVTIREKDVQNTNDSSCTCSVDNGKEESMNTSGNIQDEDVVAIEATPTDQAIVENVKKTITGDLTKEAEKLLSKLVELTDNLSVLALESIYTQLSQCLKEYKQHEDRGFVLHEMEKLFKIVTS